VTIFLFRKLTFVLDSSLGLLNKLISFYKTTVSKLKRKIKNQGRKYESIYFLLLITEVL